MKDVRILVTGSRDWWDYASIQHALTEAQTDHPADAYTLVHGAAAGADLIAAGIAIRLGWQTDPFPLSGEDWDKHGGITGFLRNQAMVDKGADVCLAFFMPCRKPTCRKPKPHDSHGAADCARRAERAGIPVRPYREETP